MTKNPPILTHPSSSGESPEAWADDHAKQCACGTQEPIGRSRISLLVSRMAIVQNKAKLGGIGVSGKSEHGIRYGPATGPYAQNKPNSAAAGSTATPTEKGGYESKRRLCTCERQSQLAEGASRGSYLVEDCAEQSQFVWRADAGYGPLNAGGHLLLARPAAFWKPGAARRMMDSSMQ